MKKYELIATNQKNEKFHLKGKSPKSLLKEFYNKHMYDFSFENQDLKIVVYDLTACEKIEFIKI